MPTAQTNGINVYYEVHGHGPNLVLIEGVGYHTWMWYRQLPAFSKHFRTLIYDNRGVGRSDRPAGPYSHRMNADDLAGLLDRLGWDRTHVLGVSMGGFIAQEFALAYPERVERLVLVATAFGGPNMVPVSEETLKALTPDPAMSPEERMRSNMPLAFADSSWVERNREEFDRMVAWRLEYPQTREAAMAQLQAGVNFNTERRLSEIKAPTLVVTGGKDRVVPPGNADLLAARISNARLGVIPDAGHLVFIEEADRFNREVVTFLSSANEGQV